MWRKVVGIVVAVVVCGGLMVAAVVGVHRLLTTARDEAPQIVADFVRNQLRPGIRRAEAIKYSMETPKSAAELSRLRKDNDVHGLIVVGINPATDTSSLIWAYFAAGLRSEIDDRFYDLPRCYNNVGVDYLTTMTELAVHATPPFTPEQWMKGARTLGIDCVAVMTAQGGSSPDSCTVSIVPVDVRGGRKLAPLHYSGTFASLLQQLPAICADLAKACKVAPTAAEQSILTRPVSIDADGLVRCAKAVRRPFRKDNLSVARQIASQYPKDHFCALLKLWTEENTLPVDDAAKITQQVLATAPPCRSLYTTAASFYFNRQRTNDLDLLKRACDAVYPHDTMMLANWAVGISVEEVNRGAESLPVLQAQIPLNPISSLIYYDIGEVHSNRAAAVRKCRYINKMSRDELNFVMEEYDKALAAYRQATTLHPRFAAAWTQQIYFNGAQCDMENAEKAYRKAVAANPRYAGAYTNMMNMYLPQWSDDPEGMSRVISEAEKVKNPSAEFCEDLATECVEAKRGEGAEFFASRALNLEPHPSCNALWAMSFGKRRMGDHAAGLKYLQKALDAWGTAADPHHTLCGKADDRLEAGDVQSARLIYKKIMDIHSHPQYGETNFGIATYACGHYDEAEQAWIKALTYRPQRDAVEAAVGLALCANRKGDAAAARDHLAKAVALAPNILTAQELKTRLWPQPMISEVLSLKKMMEMN